ncbi:MAG: hypothetical protein Q4B77_02705 [Coriobacteriaceae bacterium]|nr:hypothetical protein [Coriobacteriaceae bacterium]
MKLALAQINERLGDFDGICSRIEKQALLAHEAGADLLCMPAPLFCGVTPASFAEYPNYEHDLLRHLRQVALAVEPLGIACLVPAVLALEAGQLFEVFLLREGRVVPLRLTMIRHHDELPVSPWSPPIFEVAGTRVAATFDVMRDIDSIPGGCDLVVYFCVNGFDASDETTAAVAAVSDGAFSAQVERAGVWMACMSAVGGYDASVYTGGSFVMDDAGRVVSQAPCFEEALLIQDVQRGMMTDVLPSRELPVYSKELWLWEALRLYVRDAVAAQGSARVVVPMTGDTASSLLASLAVDALGSRNVLGLLVSHEDACTSAAQRAEDRNADVARELASSLRIRLVERVAPSEALVFDRDAVSRAESELARAIDALLLADTARVQSAVPLSAFTKTDAALRANALSAIDTGVIAPFADVFLSTLTCLARCRMGAAAALPGAVLDATAQHEEYRAVVRDAVALLHLNNADMEERCCRLLAQFDAAQVDQALAAHVERNVTLEDLPLFDKSPEMSAVLMLLVRRNEAGRRRLPMYPIVSGRSFAERLWPEQLAWSDFGLRSEERLTAADFAEQEYQRLEQRGDERGAQARGEVMGMLGALLGLTPEQQQELMSEEGQQRMRAELHELEGNMRDMLRKMAASQASHSQEGEGGPGLKQPFSFFSLN